MAKAKEILANRPELGLLGQAIEKRKKYFKPIYKVAGKDADSHDSLKGKKEGDKAAKKDVTFKGKSKADKLTKMFERGDFDDLIEKELACEIRLTLTAEDRKFFDKAEGLTKEDIMFFENTHQIKDTINNIWDHHKEGFEKKIGTWLTQIIKNKEPIQDNRAKFHQWDPLRIYLSVTDARIGQFSVRFLGQEVAKIRIQNDVAFLVITKKHKKTNEDYFKYELEQGKYPWVGTEAKQFRAYFKKLDYKKIEVGSPKHRISPEHRLESNLIQEMLKKDRNKFGKNLKNIQPVTIEGMPFQMPSPISASKGSPEKGHGHIDILARRGRGRQVRISVWELKGPHGKIDHVIEQVYIYTVVLLYMLRSGSGKDWYKLFGFKEFPSKLEIEAVIAVSVKKEEDCIKKFQEFIDKNSSCMNVNGDTIKLFMGLYDLDEQGSLRSVNLEPLKPIEKAL